MPAIADEVSAFWESNHIFRRSIDELVARFEGLQVDRVLGMEARGFIVAAPVAYTMHASFVPVRKAGKLPWAVVREEYALEYGRDKLEMHRDAIHPGERILVIDDVLATGGTADATVKLVEALGGTVVGLGFLLEIGGLGGRVAGCGSWHTSGRGVPPLGCLGARERAALRRACARCSRDA